MEEKHKKILQQNMTQLVKGLDLPDLYGALLKKDIFTKDMIDELQIAGIVQDQVRQLVQALETRGSRAFPLFLECLWETGQHGLAELLQTEAPTVPRPRPGCKSYKMESSPCGHCLIINNMEFKPESALRNRRGSNIDCEKLETRFKAINFIVEVKENLKESQIKQEMSALSKKDHSQYDCCVVIVLSHGTEVRHSGLPGAIYGVDGKHVTVHDLTLYLNGQNCPSLQEKPKLFFIQACGGDERDTGFEVSSDEAQPSTGGVDNQTDAIPTPFSNNFLSLLCEIDARASLPTQSDILVSYSTFPGYVSWRDTQAGSWYVETLERILKENAATDDLCSMLVMVNHHVSQNCAKGLYKQMPFSFNLLRKLLYFQTST
nr:caspase-9-like [Nothobranchius furzeri]